MMGKNGIDPMTSLGAFVFCMMAIVIMGILFSVVCSCSNPSMPETQPDLVEVSVKVTGTAEKCRVHYAISEGEFSDWLILNEFPWTMNLDVERNRYIEVELNSLSYGGYFDLSVYANGQWYTVQTDEPYDWVSLKIMVE